MAKKQIASSSSPRLCRLLGETERDRKSGFSWMCCSPGLAERTQLAESQKELQERGKQKYKVDIFLFLITIRLINEGK